MSILHRGGSTADDTGDGPAEKRTNQAWNGRDPETAGGNDRFDLAADLTAPCVRPWPHSERPSTGSLWGDTGCCVSLTNLRLIVGQ